MQKEKFNDVLAHISSLCRIYNHECYIVGGYLRDSILGLEPKDIDLLFVGDSMSNFLSDITTTRIPGSNVVVTGFTQVNPRFETYTVFFKFLGDSVLPVEISLVNHGQLLENLKSRDITINTLILGLSDKPMDTDVQDYQNQAHLDIMKRVVRACNDYSVVTDPIRFLRMIRFAYSLPGFSMDEYSLTRAALSLKVKYGGLIDSSKERVGVELRKACSDGVLYHVVNTCYQKGIVINRTLHQYLQNMENCEQSGPWHLEGNVLKHTLLVLKNLVGEKDVHLQMAALLHDIGKPKFAKTQEDGRITFHGHGDVSQEIREILVGSLGWSSSDCVLITSLVRDHQAIQDAKPENAKSISKFINLPHYKQLIRLGIADTRGSVKSPEKEIHTTVPSRVALGVIKHGYRFNSMDIRIGGSDLINHYGSEPGILFGKALSDLRSLAAELLVEQRDEISKDDFKQMVLERGRELESVKILLGKGNAN